MGRSNSKTGKATPRKVALAASARPKGMPTRRRGGKAERNAQGAPHPALPIARIGQEARPGAHDRVRRGNGADDRERRSEPGAAGRADLPDNQEQEERDDGAAHRTVERPSRDPAGPRARRERAGGLRCCGVGHRLALLLAKDEGFHRLLVDDGRNLSRQLPETRARSGRRSGADAGYRWRRSSSDGTAARSSRQRDGRGRSPPRGHG